MLDGIGHFKINPNVKGPLVRYLSVSIRKCLNNIYGFQVRHMGVDLVSIVGPSR